MVTDTARPLSQTHRQDRLQYTAPQLASAQCNKQQPGGDRSSESLSRKRDAEGIEEIGENCFRQQLTRMSGQGSERVLGQTGSEHGSFRYCQKQQYQPSRSWSNMMQLVGK